MTGFREHEGRWHGWLAGLILLLYCACFLCEIPGWMPKDVRQGTRYVRDQTMAAIKGIVSSLDEQSPPWELVSGTYLAIIAGVIPFGAGLLLGRRPAELGWRRPNGLFGRYILVSLILSIPFLVWMVRSPSIAGPYLRQLQQMGIAAFAGYYLVNMFTEHLLLHGVVLGLARPNGRWADPAPAPPVSGSGWRFLARWLGVAMQSPAESNGRLLDWLGIPRGCLFPMLLSSLMFGVVHLGKDSRELILSFPGGLLQAFIAYRTNSWLTPFLVHLVTASGSLAMMIAAK